MTKHFDFHGKTEEFVAAKLPNLIQENVLKNNETIVLISGRGTYAMKTHLENYLNEYEGISYSWDDRSNSFFVRKKEEKNTYQDDDSEDNFYKDYFDESNYFTLENSALNKDVEEIFQSFKFKK
ncbi:hypothetical protein K6989_03480 [Mycoplasmopsis synoviae]|uniref:hypothetical protein n=1 Tax=Mycoplasmopsis synoviae TaxID=2109 RepID=UPI001CE051A1|nr:hypothetical protein [Mycoplasmopsis synoviae]UBX97414.1 hypothetical protein K6989_03480 [Mycoplasmopsis synoviae]UBX98102.1 hypothetical protein K6987_00035 [Mycoplasmopsis synoviae]